MTIQSLNNKMKKYIHFLQCVDGHSAEMALRKYKVVEQIVETVGGGAKSAKGLDVGALWIGKRLTEKKSEVDLPDAFRELVSR